MLGVRQGEEINRRMGRAMPELNLEGKEEFTKQIKEEWAKLPLSETTGFAVLMRVLTKLPAADVRPVVRGRDICDTVNGHCEFKCSVCCVELSSVYGGNNDFGLDGGYFNFCPNCGADMREES